MKLSVDNSWYWAPRFLGLLMVFFVGMFALDAFANGLHGLRTFGEFALHLIPAMVLFGALLIGWRYDSLGSWLFTFLGIAYMVITRLQGPWSWYVFITGPLFVIAFLFWRSNSHQKARQGF